MREELKLFKVILTTPTNIKVDYLKEGYIYNFEMTPVILKDIKDFILTPEKANKTFHKSREKIQNTNMEQLIAEQVLHYFSTYGMESLGLSSLNYIPFEKLEIPELKEGYILFIRAVDRKELKKLVLKYVKGAIHEDYLEDLQSLIIKYALLSKEEILTEVNNYELKIRLIYYYNIELTDPVDFLRYLIYSKTGETLLIKNNELIKKIKESNIYIDYLLDKAPSNLAEIFFRFKPLFLALKHSSRNKTFFNKLRKQANKLHKPLKLDYLSTISFNTNPNFDKLLNEIKNKDTYRLVRLYNTLNYRKQYNNIIIYKIRNGKTWIPLEGFKNHNIPYDTILAYLKQEIKDRVNKNLDGKKIYIPENINYAFPISDKNFIGYIPEYTRITTRDNMIIGVYWENLPNDRVDLDLSYLDGITKGGWNGNRKNNDMLFSGDITDAPNGATELFYIKNPDICALFKLNHYNGYGGVPYKIFIAYEKIDNLTKNYMVNPNNLIIIQNDNLKYRQAIIGFIDKNNFYFVKNYDGYVNVSNNNDKTNNAKSYLQQYTQTVLMLSDVVNITNIKPNENYIDLSPEKLDKSSFKLFLNN